LLRSTAAVANHAVDNLAKAEVLGVPSLLESACNHVPEGFDFPVVWPITDLQLLDLEVVAHNFQLHSLDQKNYEGSKSWKGLNQQFDSTSAILCKWIAKEEKAFLSVDLKQHPAAGFDPHSFLLGELQKWTPFWQQPNVSHTLGLALQHLREHVAAELEPQLIEPLALRKSANSYKKNSLGGDAWGPKEVANLPDVSLAGLTDALNVSKKLATVAHQNRFNLHPLLGKKIGFRTVCKTPMLYRLDSRTDTTVMDWEINNSGSFDSCVPGASALDAAILRNAQAEAASLTGQCVAAIFNDYHTFFDTIDVEQLLSRSILADFPLPVLNIAAQQHCAPRALQEGFFDRTCPS